MKRCIVALPVDGRPVVRQQVQQLVACAGWDLRLPAVSALGHFRQPADRDALRAWLLAQAGQASGVVLSLDMLLYGGLVPSRFIDDSLASLQARLALLAELKAAQPDLPVYAFAATMRLSNNNVADEEKSYWALYGEHIWQWSYHSDRAAHTGDNHSAQQAQAAAARIPPHIQADYRATRQRNFTLTAAALQAVASGLIDRLVLPQDDTAQWGFNIAERRELQARVQAAGLQDRVLIYPGADEVLHTLCAHLVQRLQGKAPLRVAVAYSDPEHVGALHALYEDRPLTESVQQQIEAVGATRVSSADGADLLLAVHSQGQEQGDWAMQKPLPQRPGITPNWWAQWQAAAQRQQPVALVDLAYANGGDPQLLAQNLPPFFTYAAWNTASNSLGGALAHATLAHCGQAWHSEASDQVRALRLLEDLAYQAVLRQTLRDRVSEDQIAHNSAATTLLLPELNAWAAQQGLRWRVARLSFPWQRSFEIDLSLEAAP
jgi:Protein of unknown function (DUF4127)